MFHIFYFVILGTWSGIPSFRHVYCFSKGIVTSSFSWILPGWLFPWSSLCISVPEKFTDLMWLGVLQCHCFMYYWYSWSYVCHVVFSLFLETVIWTSHWAGGVKNICIGGEWIYPYNTWFFQKSKASTCGKTGAGILGLNNATCFVYNIIHIIPFSKNCGLSFSCITL